MAKKELSAAEKAKRSQKSKESRQRRLNAIAKVVKFVEDNHDELPSEINAAIRRIKGERRGGSGTVSKREVILDYVRQNGPVKEEDIFLKFKLGRAEMRLITNDLIKKVNDPEDRVWVQFDAEECTYEVIAEGAEIPTGWDGYLPPELQDTEDEMDYEDDEDDEDFDFDEEE